ncbi:hypothetical protein BDV25DRAFT_145031 [Aspergillus avenaceus]|uniref:DUF7820 domain-containing protein n=1 Tax=Aspergillus avenaceus TaxID=36643 RepID=A0A5N6TFD2_ASPAV|nr:hypothetical protein BDV25DRAFT_145031 [Aspergillus avenaceus]
MPGHLSSDHSRSLSQSSQSPSQRYTPTQDTDSMHQNTTSNTPSNPNVFSDEYSLEQIDSEQATLTPRSPSVSSVASSNTLRSSLPQQHAQPKQFNTTPNDLGVTENPFGDDARVSFDEPSSRSSLPLKGVDYTNRDSTASTNTAPSIAQRSQSTSSRFSMPPRALSPYTGATGPSHPYAMYPQVGVSRSPSIATTSTIRPMDRPLGDTNAPQHPYAMYPQNVVAEEEMDAPVDAPVIPVGFPGHTQAYQRPPNRADDDVGDLIGPDGHTEQLPPYSRYPDPPAVPKVEGTFDPVPDAGGVALHDTTPNERQEPPVSEVSSRTVVADPPPNREENYEPEPAAATGVMAFEEKLKSKGKKKACCGLPVWTLVLIGVVMLVGACIGGVIGGVLGAKKAAASEESHKPKGPEVVTITQNPRMDATPISTIPSNLPAAPTGDFVIPAAPKNISKFCIVEQDYTPSWNCMRRGEIPISVTGTESSRNISFPKNKLSSSFTYGAQPPYFSDSAQSLTVMMDSNDLSLGPALTFFSLFDKLVILPQDTFSSSSVSKRSVNEDEVLANSYRRLQVARAGDKPWFCWWNSTVMEFFMYLNQSTKVDNYGPTTTTLFATQTTGTASVATATSTSIPDYPLRIKMEEKRDYSGAQNPYCQQMQVLRDGSVSPVSHQRIQIKELEPTPTTTLKYSGSATQTYTAKAQYESVCYCVSLTD